MLVDGIKKEHLPRLKNILIDFSSIRTGGGVQLARNFLSGYENTDFNEFQCTLLLPGAGELSQHKPLDDNISCLKAPVKLLSRVFFQHTHLQRFMKNDNIKGIYTFFGPGVPHKKSIPSLVSIAYPIICYPDSPFWKYLPFKRNLRQRWLNFLRCRRIHQATHLLVETEVMKNRLVKYLGINEKLITIIPPVASLFLEDRPGNPNRECRNFLLLSGTAFHKNLWRLYEVAQLAEQKQLDIVFSITVSKEAWLKTIPNHNISQGIIDRYFRFLGKIPTDKIGEVYDQADALINLSDLESFSNNYMESWKAGIPMICSDRDFAHCICRNSAIYVEPHDPSNIIDGIVRLADSSQLRKQLIEEGKSNLSELPTFKERNNEIVKILSSLIY